MLADQVLSNHYFTFPQQNIQVFGKLRRMKTYKAIEVEKHADLNSPC